MIVLTDREVSNWHGTGVLTKNILIGVGDKQNIALCKAILTPPDDTILHYSFNDYKIYRGSKYVQKLLLSRLGSFLYFRYKKINFSAIPLEQHNRVLVTIWHDDALWITLKFMRLYPHKEYLLFMMDNYIDFSDSPSGLLNRKAFAVISAKASVRITISKNLAHQLLVISGKPFNIFYGPRKVNWKNVELNHQKRKNNNICLVGNVWVGSVLPVIDEQLRKNKIRVTWFIKEEKFEELKAQYSLTNFIFGGSYSSEEVIEKTADFSYGLILYGLDIKAEHYYYRKLQDYSIPSKMIDYCMAGTEPLYFGPEDTACYDFLQENKIGVFVNNKIVENFFQKVNNEPLTPSGSANMKKVLQNCSIDKFLELINN